MVIVRKFLFRLAALAVVGFGIWAFASPAGPSFGGQDDSGEPNRELKVDSLPCTGAEDKPNFRTFGLGESFGGKTLAEALRRCDVPYPGEPVVANYVSYIYGDCKLEEVGENRQGCQPPLEVQTWPSCHRSFADYPPRMRHDVGPLGVVGKSQFANFGERVEIYSGKSTIVLFSPDPEVLRTASERLGEQDYLESNGWLEERSSSDLSADQTRMESAAAGAIEGELPCD